MVSLADQHSSKEVGSAVSEGEKVSRPVNCSSSTVVCLFVFLSGALDWLQFFFSRRADHEFPRLGSTRQLNQLE